MNEAFPPRAAVTYLESVSRRLRRSLQRKERSPCPTIKLGKEFEKALGILLHKAFPSAVQKNLKLSLPDAPQCEIDNLIHIRLGSTDYLVEVEVKLQDIQSDSENQWMARYPGGPEDVKDQINKHLKALHALYWNQSNGIDLRFVVFVCTSGLETASEMSTGYGDAELHLIPFHELLNRMTERFHLNSDGKVVCLTESNAFFSFQERSIPGDNPLVVGKRLSVSDLTRRILRDKRTVLNKMRRLGIETAEDRVLAVQQMQQIAREFGYNLFFVEGAPDLIHLKEPISAKTLAAAMNLKEFSINRILMDLNIYPDPGMMIDLDDAKECCRRLGYCFAE